VSGYSPLSTPPTYNPYICGSVQTTGGLRGTLWDLKVFKHFFLERQISVQPNREPPTSSF